jgi:hypothetical protein
VKNVQLELTEEIVQMNRKIRVKKRMMKMMMMTMMMIILIQKCLPERVIERKIQNNVMMILKWMMIVFVMSVELDFMLHLQNIFSVLKI